MSNRILLKALTLAWIIMSLLTTNATYAELSQDGHIAYQDIGSGRPIVLIHAFPSDQRLWKPQQEGLKHKFRVITLDLWGFGQSFSVNGKAVTMTDYADEVAQLLTELHIDKAIIGGESMGGYVAMAFLEKYPQRVNGLILSNTQSISDSEEAKAKREVTAADVLVNGTSGLIEGFIPKALSDNAPDEMRDYLRHILQEQSPLAVASALRGMALRSNLSVLLANSELPILILTGDKDTVISPSQSEAMHLLAKNSKLVMIANAGHLSSLEKPEEWNCAVENFYHD
jgi:pimeloyl-ACP methyl ester carboxylesterase